VVGVGDGVQRVEEPESQVQAQVLDHVPKLTIRPMMNFNTRFYIHLVKKTRLVYLPK
jgi:hypothetical protein